MSEQSIPHGVYSDELGGHAIVDTQLSESENGSDMGWVKVRRSKAKQSKGTSKGERWDSLSNQISEDYSEELSSKDHCDVEQLSLSESALAVLKPAYDGLATEQHDLMKSCTASMRQGEHQKAYLALVEETIEKFVSFAMSCTGKTLDATATDRLKEIQGNFVNDKTELLNRVAWSEECTDRLHAHHYRVARQQSWFMSLLQRLLYGSGGNSKSIESGPNPVVEADTPSSPETYMDTPVKQESLLDNSDTEQARQTPPATMNSDSSESRFGSSQSSSFGTIAGEQTVKDDRSSEAIQSPDSLWATTVWKIIEGQTELEASNAKGKDDG